MIKKISDKDKKDWLDFLNSEEKLENKDFDVNKNTSLNDKIIDLHGYTLDKANKLVHDSILYCYQNNIKRIKVITGKGSRSKNRENPYQSENLSILKYSVPEYIKSDEELMCKIKEINFDDVNSSLKGSFKIFLKKYKN